MSTQTWTQKGVTSKQSADDFCGVLPEHIPIAILTNEVRQAIKMRGGSGFEWLRIQCGDSQTTGSTVDRHRYRENLDWLLSLK